MLLSEISACSGTSSLSASNRYTGSKEIGKLKNIYWRYELMMDVLRVFTNIDSQIES